MHTPPGYVCQSECIKCQHASQHPSHSHHNTDFGHAQKFKKFRSKTPNYDLVNVDMSAFSPPVRAVKIFTCGLLVEMGHMSQH